MSQLSPNETALARVLERHADEIAEAWTDLIYQVSDKGTDPRERDTTLRLTRGSVLGIAHAWRTGSYKALEEHMGAVHEVNMQSSATIDWIIESLLLMTDAALPVILRTYAADADSMQSALAQLDLTLRWMTAYLARLYSDANSRHLREQQERAEQLLRIAGTVGNTLDLDSVLDAVCDSLTSAVPGCRCHIFLVESGNLLPARCCAGDISLAEFAARAVEEHGPALHSPSALPQVAFAAESPQVLAFPFLVRDRPVAAAVLCREEAGRPLGEADLRTVWSISSIVAPVIDHACRHRQVEQLTIRQERDRLSRELHDNLAQAVGTLGLQIGEAQDLLQDGRVAPAQAKLHEVRETVDRVYTDIREAIFNLRRANESGATFLAALDEYLSDYRLHYGIDARMAADGEVPNLAPEVWLQLVRIIQEALSNVRKHARVQQAQVTVRVAGKWVEVTIEDQGAGFDPAITGAMDPQRFGLKIMGERAEGVGGSLRIETQPGHGTRILARVPHQSQE